MLIQIEREHEVSKNRLEVRRKFWSSIFFKSGEGTAASFLDPFIVIQNHAEKLSQMNLTRGNRLLENRIRTPSMVGIKYKFLCSSEIGCVHQLA
jgi:hypothetical protein